MTIRPVALLLVASSAPVLSQEPPVFKAGVELVRLDVIVLDHDGHPVTGLTAEDFTVEEGEDRRRSSPSSRSCCAGRTRRLRRDRHLLR